MLNKMLAFKVQIMAMLLCVIFISLISPEVSLLYFYHQHRLFLFCQ